MRHLLICAMMLPTVAHAVCDSTSDLTERRACLNIELRLADVDINKAYNELLTLLGSAEKAKVQAEQREW